MSTNNGGPAFPRSFSGNSQFDIRSYDKEKMLSNEGMSLRDWFAGQALSNMYGGDGNKLNGARYCYEWADAMLKAREETK